MYEIRVEKAAQKTPYPVESFWFVLQVLLYTNSVYSRFRRVDAAEVCWRLRNQATASFGVNARAKLESWGIRSTGDFGKIVYALIDEDLVGIRGGNSIEDFVAVYDFDKAFNLDEARSRKVQWSLPALFAVTTIVAIAYGGGTKLGYVGAMGTLACSWLGLVGAVCVYLGIADRAQGWLLPVCVGLVLLVTGIAGFVALIF
ncbi:MAG: Minf_1886 family protein [Planctomycetota bacterium]